MGALSTEVNNMQNPALGAVLLWRFCVGYESSSNTRNPAPLPVLFLVLPVLLHEETADMVKGTQAASGLRAFAEKFKGTQRGRSDLLLAIHERSLRSRPLTLSSLQLAVNSHLLTILTDTADVASLTQTEPRAAIPESIRPLLAAAHKMGGWLSDLTIYEISSVLKVSF